MSPKRVRTCVLYVRISLRTDESVSIARQIEAGEAYAKARGWRVVGVFKDEGVSATHNRPEDREGWRAVLDAATGYDAVVIWKVDRLARRVIDFLNANEAVKARGAGIVAVEDPIDMTTAQGEAFAIMLAVFGQMESAAMRDRQRAARNHLLRVGRYPGGVVLYGYKSVPNPDGPGYLLTHDEDQIGYVREMVRRTLAGLSIYSTKQWLEEVGAPTSKGVESWGYTTVDRIIRHPLLAGMVPHNPGNTTSHTRGDDVVRDEDGLPVVDEALAIMPVGQWRAMVAKLEAQDKPQRRPVALRRKWSGLLSGLVWCADCDVRMQRKALGTKERPRAAYNCPDCGQTITSPDELVVAEFLATGGDDLRLRMVQEVVEGGAVQLQEASVRLAELGREVVNATPERASEIVAEMTRLKEVQEEAKHQPARVEFVPVGDEQTYAQDWEAATTDEDRRLILGQALNRVLVRRGKWGDRTDAGRLARLTFDWMPGFPATTAEEFAAQM